MSLCLADVTGDRHSGGMKLGKAKRLFEEAKIWAVPSMERCRYCVMRSQRHQENMPDPTLEPQERDGSQMDWVVWQLTVGHPVNGLFLLAKK